ncbi:MAG: L,D-transpeptidase family protein [Minisyncoccia bacterium]
MKKLNLKNKILVIIILFLGIFSFFGKALAQTTTEPLTDNVLECKLSSVDKNNPTNMSGPKYWFLPPEGVYSHVWKSFNTLAECEAGLKLYAPVPIPGAGGSVNTDTTYTPLASLPGLEKFDSAKANSFGDYLNILIRLFIGICAVLAMIMIVIGGIEYMTSEISGHKEEGKERITNAIFGLIIALGAYALLFTINPQLLDVSLSGVPQAIISPDEANFIKTEQPITSAGAGYKMNGTFLSPAPSVGVLDFKNNYLKNGYSLTGITVNTSAKQATFMAKKGSAFKAVSVSINTGQSGVSEIGQAKEGDLKTPKGTTSITSDRRPTPEPPIEGKAALTRDGKYNMGAAFINLGATTGGRDRGIGFHGAPDNGLGSTNACIRMRNDDLVVLSPYMVAGLQVIIQ